MPQKQSDSNVGKVIEIKGVVLDVVFTGSLPEINTALELQVRSEDGSGSRTLPKPPWSESAAWSIGRPRSRRSGSTRSSGSRRATGRRTRAPFAPRGNP